MLQARESLTTIAGLPLHPLAVHAAVVLLPLGVAAVMAIVLVPKWRRHYAIPALALLVAGAGSAFVAEQTGEQLALVTGITQEHRQYGKVMVIDAFIMLALSLVWFWIQSRGKRSANARFGSGLQFIAASGVLLAGVASFVVIALVGHSGATAVWQGKLSAPAPTVAATNTTAADYTFASVAKHSSAADCWSIINGNVYDLTNWISRHPGGARVIESLCGIDGSAPFAEEHGSHGDPSAYLDTFKLGALTK